MSFTPIDRHRFEPVVEALQAEAQLVLAEAAVHPVSHAEAERLVRVSLPSDGQCVLLRGVVLNEATGAFEVGLHGQAVLVRHECLGAQPVPMVRKALVAVLPSMPTKVYVTCGMDE